MRVCSEGYQDNIDSAWTLEPGDKKRNGLRDDKTGQRRSAGTSGGKLHLIELLALVMLPCLLTSITESTRSVFDMNMDCGSSLCAMFTACPSLLQTRVLYHVFDHHNIASVIGVG